MSCLNEIEFELRRENPDLEIISYDDSSVGIIDKNHNKVKLSFTKNGYSLYKEKLGFIGVFTYTEQGLNDLIKAILENLKSPFERMLDLLRWFSGLNSVGITELKHFIGTLYNLKRLNDFGKDIYENFDAFLSEPNYSENKRVICETILYLKINNTNEFNEISKVAYKKSKYNIKYKVGN